MLLNLFAASFEGGSVSVSSACLGSDCAVSTAVLWVRKLEEAGLVRRCPDARDRRRTFLETTPIARGVVEDWLETVFAA